MPVPPQLLVSHTSGQQVCEPGVVLTLKLVPPLVEHCPNEFGQNATLRAYGVPLSISFVQSPGVSVPHPHAAQARLSVIPLYQVSVWAE